MAALLPDGERLHTRQGHRTRATSAVRDEPSESYIDIRRWRRIEGGAQRYFRSQHTQAVMPGRCLWHGIGGAQTTSDYQFRLRGRCWCKCSCVLRLRVEPLNDIQSTAPRARAMRLVHHRVEACMSNTMMVSAIDDVVPIPRACVRQSCRAFGRAVAHDPLGLMLWRKARPAAARKAVSHHR